MSKIEELIKEKCLNGVEYKKLRAVIKSLKTGLNPRKSFVLNADGADLYYVTGKDIINNCINVSKRTDLISQDVVNLINRRANIEVNDVLFISTGTGTVGRMAVVSEYNNDWAVSETVFCLKPQTDIVLPNYLMYALYARETVLQYEPKISKGSVPHLKVNDLLDVQIPIPPMEIQQEIVRILDKFTELEAELQNELEARKKQYEYYRDELLAFDEEVECVELGNIAPSKRGKRVVKSQLSADQGYPVYQNSLTPLGYHNDTNCKANTTFVICAGAAGEIGYSKDDFWAADDCYYYECPSNLYNRYLFYVMINQKKLLKDKVRKGSVPRISRDDVDSLVIPLPSLEMQIEIVSKLDKWDKICNDYENGLPAEIEACHKQYEYYRDKLLTFERKVV